MMDKIDELYLNGIIGIILAVTSNFVGNTLSCKSQALLEKSMICKHLIILLTIFVAVDAVFTANTTEKTIHGKKKRQSPVKTLISTILLYIAFLVLTKMNIHATIGSFITLVILYFIDLCKEYYEDKTKILIIVRDIVRIALALLVVGGFTHFSVKKFIEKKGNFSPILLLFQVPTCKVETSY